MRENTPPSPQALNAAEADMSAQEPRRPLLCRTHLHHKWVAEHTEDGGDFSRCAHCGKDRTEVDEGNFGGKNYGAGLAGSGGGG
jgi:hypothetical protein